MFVVFTNLTFFGVLGESAEYCPIELRLVDDGNADCWFGITGLGGMNGEAGEAIEPFVGPRD